MPLLLPNDVPDWALFLERELLSDNMGTAGLQTSSAVIVLHPRFNALRNSEHIGPEWTRVLTCQLLSEHCLQIDELLVAAELLKSVRLTKADSA